MHKSVTIDELTNKLLVVPFNDDYKVENYIRQLLTEEEFFEHCFVEPSFDEEIEKSLEKNGEEVDDFEFNLEKGELIDRLKRHKEEFSALHSWIMSGQPDLYCIKGDAGTGKTTFLHYLKYHYRHNPTYWNIIDIQNATEQLSVMGSYIKFPHFHTLYAKSTSAILFNLVRDIFLTDEDGNYLLDDTARTIIQLANTYKEKFRGRFPREEVEAFFSGLYIECDESEIICRESAKHIQNWVNNLIQNEQINGAFSIILELYIYYVTCIGDMDRHMIAFDNFERFIGTDEIFNFQLTEFVSKLRSIQKTIYRNNKLQYQILIFMRNTSVRMFTSMQVTEFFPHTIDLSDWFDASIVLKKKIEWYHSKNIDIPIADILLDIFNDMGVCGDSLRGLHFKISMLFNYNKRLVIRFLVDIVTNPVNKNYVKKYKYFWEECDKLKPSLNKFAARSIIYRLILNSLRKDGLFIYIIEQSSSTQNGSNEFNSLGCARKILSVLYEHHLRSAHNAESAYMDLSSLISRIFTSKGNSMELLLEGGNRERLDAVSQVLYHMNYYDGRKENWLQFIDIQYNITDEDNVIINDYPKLKECIQHNYQNIKIRITNAGIAYMFYVVNSFEFFACKSINKKPCTVYFGTADIPPLLCSIPSEDEIKGKEISTLACVKSISVVSTEALSCIQRLNKSDNPIPFQAKLNGNYRSHQERIVNAHKGFIDNFVECLILLYKDKCSNDKVFKGKFEELHKQIIELRNQYSIDYGSKKD